MQAQRGNRRPPPVEAPVGYTARMTTNPVTALAGPAGRSSAVPLESGPDGLPVQDENGVDLTLIRAMLALTPLERLQQAEAWMRQLSEARPVAPVKRP